MPPLGREFTPTPKSEAELLIERELAQAQILASEQAFELVEQRLRDPNFGSTYSQPYSTEEQPEGTQTVAVLTSKPHFSSYQVALSTCVLGADERPNPGTRQQHATFSRRGGKWHVTELVSAYREFTPSQELELIRAIIDTLAQFSTGDAVDAPVQSS